MTCEIKLLAKIVDFIHIQEYFGFSQDENWLNCVYYSLSPTGEILTFAHGTKLAVLGSRWDTDLQQNNYILNWKCDLENPNDCITSIICLPVVSLSVNTQNSADWTCILIGLTSGLVLCYTDSGVKLYSQQWHNEPVQSIKAQSGKTINEEIFINYLSCVCIIQGNNFFQVLRSLKQQMMKVHSNKVEILALQDTISCKKWGYSNKNIIINDSNVVGPQKSCTFDHLLANSLEGGFFAKYRSAPHQNSLVLSVGTKPYVGFHFAKEGFVQPVLADVARAVANKFKSALPNWLVGTTVQETEVPPPPTPSEPMVCKYGICDIQRNGLGIWLAPNHDIAVVADNLGRIILIDCLRGIATRVWKGYREAQCSFIEVHERNTKSNDKSNRRKALFLIIFAPRRSCIEIWPLQKGPKIAAFYASKHGQLIYNAHSLMGVANGAKVKYVSHSCVFFDPSDHSFKEIVIPFHCALSDANSKTAKDLHIMKRLKLCLRGGGSDAEIIEEATTICSNFQTHEIKLQSIDMLIKNNKIQPKILFAALLIFKEQYLNHNENRKEQDNLGNLETISLAEHIYILSTSYIKLIEFYMYLKGIETSTSENIKNDFIDNNKKLNVDKFQLSVNELESLQKLLELSLLSQNNASNGQRVKFDVGDIKSNVFNEYLAAFLVNASGEIMLKEEKTECFSNIGKDIFKNCLEYEFNMNEFINSSVNSGISSGDLIKILLYYWLEKPFNFTKTEELIMDMTNFSQVIQYICLMDKDNIQYEYNTVSLWWQKVREILLVSNCAFKGLLAALIFRNISAKYCLRELSNEDNAAINVEENLWEQVSQEGCEWTLLIGKLEDVAILGAILNIQIKCDTLTLPILKYDKLDISLKTILHGGKGIVSELVTKWLASTGINPNHIIEVDNIIEVKPVKETENLEINIMEKDNACLTIISYFKLLRDHFPFSLESGVLLCQLTWEYMCYWSKNLSHFHYLEAGLNCLTAFKKSDFVIKHGLCCMVWNAHLKLSLEATKKLINKAGRLPKEKLCQQDIGLSDSYVPQFLNYSKIFLNHFLTSLSHDKIELRSEELLQEGPIPLTLLAVQQNRGIPELINLHIELVNILHLIANFNIKYAKPITDLFDAMSNQAFFTEINKNLLNPLPKSDVILRKKRVEFLYRVITATMDLIREDLEKVYLNDHIEWMDKIEAIAEIWELDIILLKKHQIIELYAHGWDVYGEECLEKIINKADVGAILLKIAGRRLQMYTRNSPNVWSQVAAAGPLLSDYLDTLSNTDLNGSDEQQNTNNMSLDRLVKLVGITFQCLADKDCKELRIAGLMFDACSTIQETLHN